MHSSVCPFLSCIRESPSASPLWCFSTQWELMLQNPLVPTARISVMVTRHDEGGEQAGTMHSAFSKGSDKPLP